jgi:hypothetical protein
MLYRAPSVTALVQVRPDSFVTGCRLFQLTAVRVYRTSAAEPVDGSIGLAKCSQCGGGLSLAICCILKHADVLKLVSGCFKSFY